MAENSQPVLAETPKKRKRKSEVEKLLEYELVNTDASSGESTENPWTPRENLEVLRIHRDYHHSSNAKQKADSLNDMMSRIRRTAYAAQKPARTDKEYMAQLRQLQNEGVTIEDLEEELFPPAETPRKKQKGGKKWVL